VENSTEQTQAQATQVLSTGLNQPTPESQQLHPTNYWKSATVVLLGLLAVCGITLIYFVMKKPVPKTVTIEPSVSSVPQTQDAATVSTQTAKTDLTLNWKTYTNAELGFSFKYPREWEASSQSSPRLESFYTNSGKPGEFFIYYHKNINNLSKWLVDNQAGKIINTTNVNGNQFTVIEGGLNFISREYAIKVGENNYLRLVFEPFPNSAFPDEVMEQILSTFKFTETDPTANWRTYTNATYKFSIKYPNNWISKEYSPPDTRIPYLYNPDNKYDIQIMYQKDEPNVISEMTGKPMVTDFSGYTPTTINNIKVYVNPNLEGNDGNYMEYFFQRSENEYIRVHAPLTNLPSGVIWDNTTTSLAKQIITSFKFIE
jgi:hypothetical protein